MLYFKRLIFIIPIIVSCQSTGKLKFEGDISLKEVSAIETIPNSKLLWTIEDSGNDSKLFGLDIKGNIVHTLNVTNTKNIDWEDLTTDKKGNVYIGDFGNNNKKRKTFRILKIKNQDLTKTHTEAEIIEFKLNKKQSKDFEAFFIFNNNFYLFSKESKKFVVVKVPNKVGKQEAKIISNYNLNGSNNKITSADINHDGNTIILLNHDKLWKLTNYSKDNFFSGSIVELRFDHHSQKEGVSFYSNSKVYITDERKGIDGGNLYTFKID